MNDVIATTTPVVVADSDGIVACWSDGARSLLGFDTDEVVGRPLDALLTGDGLAFRHREGRHVDAAPLVSPLVLQGRHAGYLLTATPEAGAVGATHDRLLTLAFYQNPTATGITDREGRLLRVNPPMARAAGWTEAELKGRLVTEFLTGPGFSAINRQLLRVAETGVPESTEAYVRAPGEPRAHAWGVDVFPLTDEAGRVQAVTTCIFDYSELHGSRKRMALINEAREHLGTSLDVARTARELAEVIVPRFADGVAVDLFDQVIEGQLAASVPVGPVALRRVAFLPHSGAPSVHQSPDDLVVHPASSLVAACLRSGRPELRTLPDPAIRRWFQEDPARAEQPRDGGAHSLIAVPLRVRGVPLGAVLLLRNARTPDIFTPDDLTVSEDLAARAAVCLDNARRFRRERGIALGLQRMLLPRLPGQHPAVETAARYLPAGGEAETGGDWFDVIPLPGARVGLVVGDVVGHGLTAAATMGRLRTAVRTLADIDLPPEELLTHLDDIVSNTADTDAAPAFGLDAVACDVGATCLYAAYDPVVGICTLASAGHLPPIMMSPQGKAHSVEVPVGPPLGLSSLPFESTEIAVPEGSVLALFTDGLIETRDQDIDARLEQLRGLLEQPCESLDELGDGILDALLVPERSDDVALLLARTRVLDRTQVGRWDIPADPSVVADVRRSVCERLSEWELEESAFSAELIVSELVTNAIRYGGGSIRLQLIKDDTLIYEVWDGSTTTPHLRRAQPSDEGGRGLFLVAQLTQRWGTRYTREGKVVWAEQARPA
ncbi:ATP-binding SpoIIE family protein phosphatase [Streptomyces sp. NBC_00582]|uniref:ATP-binding SpoIIE family protein phosphatase n=1 Tax=Streptomyces sp. NBC_00582 TaxID=2975783 RepID=UPI002E81130A|nr:SpoIIE family protein phosphatase [Streptomyces sp. NBC_00582]WUB67571.1 SpoIIE family protein phosphatase [Streptomyces sp. NBC_00582]